MSEEQTGTDIAVQPRRAVQRAPLQADGSGVFPIVPRDLEQAIRYARGLADSGIVPDAFRIKEGEFKGNVDVSLVAMGVLKVLEIGLPPQTGLAFLLPLNGRFTVWGDGAWALIQRSGQIASHTVEWHFPEGFDKDTTPLDKWPVEISCTVRLWRVGQKEPYIGKFSVGDAKRANLWNNARKQPWILYPERMLFNRARAFPQRDGFADALFGLSIAEEVMDSMAEPKRLTVDNSALDDDLPALPTHTTDGDPVQQSEAYVAGLAMIETLSDLLEYQSLPNNQALMDRLRKDDDEAYNRLVAANLQRYNEIEQAAQSAEQDAAQSGDDEEGNEP